MSRLVSMNRLCKDCRHFTNGNMSLKYGKCRLTSRVVPPVVDPVNGSRSGPTRELLYASSARYKSGDCGEEGELYEHEKDAIKRFRNAWEVPVLDTAKYAACVAAWYFACFLMVGALERMLLLM